MEGGGEEASSPKGNAVSSAALDLGDKRVAAKLAYQAADASTPAPCFVEVGRWRVPELSLEVAVRESVDEMGAGEDSLKELGVGTSNGVETSELLTVLEARTAERVELFDGGSGGGDHGEGIEIATVDGLTDLDVPPEIVDSLSHGLPETTTTSTPIVLETKDPEVRRVVDHGLDP